MILAGIDEAGLGPVLGPLVTCRSVFRIDGEAGVDLWTQLAGAVARKPSRKNPRLIAIADSKKLFNRKKKDGLAPLERGVLTSLLAADNSGDTHPVTLPHLLQRVCPGAVTAAEQYPWYGNCELTLPRCASATDVELSANALRVAMRQSGVSLPQMQAEIVFAGEFNRLVTATKNKSTTTFDITSRHLVALWQGYSQENLCVVVDRQGGRIRYRQVLQRIFPNCTFKVLAETQTRSEYMIRNDSRSMKINFLVGGENHAMPVALASMLCKYLRELFMELFNAYWRQQAGDIRATAGYYVDGRRFFQEIQQIMQQMGIDKNMIYRSR